MLTQRIYYVVSLIFYFNNKTKDKNFWSVSLSLWALLDEIILNQLDIVQYANMCTAFPIPIHVNDVMLIVVPPEIVVY